MSESTPPLNPDERFELDLLRDNLIAAGEGDKEKLAALAGKAKRFEAQAKGHREIAQNMANAARSVAGAAGAIAFLQFIFCSKNSYPVPPLYQAIAFIVIEAVIGCVYLKHASAQKNAQAEAEDAKGQLSVYETKPKRARPAPKLPQGPDQ